MRRALVSQNLCSIDVSAVVKGVKSLKRYAWLGLAVFSRREGGSTSTLRRRSRHPHRTPPYHDILPDHAHHERDDCG